EERLRAEAREGEEDLQPEDHAGEGAGQENDQQRAEADEVDAVHEGPELQRRRHHRREGRREERTEPPERCGEREGPLAEQIEWAQDGGKRGLAHLRARRYTPRAQSGKYFA